MKVFLECTHTYRSTNNTGIQRVVRSIVNESLNTSLPDDCECIPVVQRRSTYRVVRKVRHPDSTIRSLRDSKIFQFFFSFICSIVPSEKLRSWLLPASVHRGTLRVLTSLWSRCQRLSLRFLPKALMEPGDVLLKLDLGLNQDAPEFKQLRDRGVIVGGIVYDLEPVRNPQFFNDRMGVRFSRWLDTVIANYDFAVTISETVRLQLIEYLAVNRFETRLTPDRIAAFRLGADLDGAKDSSLAGENIRLELKEAFTNRKQPTFLTVGTIEPRKNHRLLLDAIDSAWALGASFRCCIVGKIGWKTQDLIRRLEAHPERGGRLLIYHDLSDGELQFVYRQCDCFVYPTHAEGFGLPLVEAMHAGLPVIASDIPIVRETSGNQGVFVSNTAFGELAAKLIQFSSGELQIPQPSMEQLAVTTWQQSAEQLLKRVIAIAASSEGRESEELSKAA